MDNFFWQGSFGEAEERDVQYYASLNWQQSATGVEEMRRKIWGSDYAKKENIIRLRRLQEEADDFS